MKCLLYIVCFLVGVKLFPGVQCLHQYQGCFRYKEFSSVRDSAHTVFQGKPLTCIKICQGFSTLYVGIQEKKDRMLCYCDQNLPEKLENVSDADCGMCDLKSGASASCGGPGVISYYKASNVSSEDLESQNLLVLRDGHSEFWSGSLSSQVSSRVRHDVRAVDFHFRRREGIALLGSMFHRFNLSIPASTVGLVHTGNRHLTSVTAFAVDWHHDHILWAEHSPPAVKVASLDGANRTLLVSLDPDAFRDIHDIAVDPYKGLLFIVTPTSLWSCQLDGRGLRRVVGGFQNTPARASRLALDLAAETVYFTTNSATILTAARILRAGYNTSGHYETFRSFVHEERVLSLTVLESSVYFVLQSKNRVGLQKASNNTATNEELIAVDGMTMAVAVDGSLQSPARRDPCTDHGCSHHCQVADDVPSCRCPSLLRLAADGKTCEAIPSPPDGWSPLLYVMVGTATLLGTALAVGALLCLATKVRPSQYSSEAPLIEPQQDDREDLCTPLELRDIAVNSDKTCHL